MDDNKNVDNQPLNTSDVRAARIQHRDMHSLLNFICQDDFGPFSRLSGADQQGVLRILRASSDTLGEILEPF